MLKEKELLVVLVIVTGNVSLSPSCTLAVLSCRYYSDSETEYDNEDKELVVKLEDQLHKVKINSTLTGLKV